MAKVSVKILKKLDGVMNARLRMEAAGKVALNDCLDDLVRASSGAAPHDTGVLEKSWSKKIQKTGNGYVGYVGYSVKEGGYDYAVRMHEDTYNLGPGSQAKPGGTGMSGKTYPVGPKFLTRSFEGEAQTYRNHMERMILGAIGR